MSLKTLLGKKTALALVTGLVVGGAAASAVAAARMTRVTAIPSTTVITIPDTIWTTAETDVVGIAGTTYRLILPSVTAKSTGYPVARLGALSATLALPSGVAMGLTVTGEGDSVPYCYVLVALEENPDGEGWSVESPSAIFQILVDSPARTETLNILGLAENLSASQRVRIRVDVSCQMPGANFLPAPTTLVLSNTRLTLTAFGA